MKLRNPFGRTPAVAGGPEYVEAEIIEQPTTAISPPISSWPKEEKIPKPPRAADGPMPMYERVGITAALVFALGIVFILWRTGASWTLSALKKLRWVPADGWGGGEWLIPIGVTLIIFFLWPKRGRRFFWPLLALWGFFVIADLWTSGWGAWMWGQGRELPIGVTLPDGGLLLGLLAALAALIVGFGPEKLLRAILSALREIWEV